jgi:hypothetical protein
MFKLFEITKMTTCVTYVFNADINRKLLIIMANAILKVGFLF